jgi:hypothetical protein
VPVVATAILALGTIMYLFVGRDFFPAITQVRMRLPAGGGWIRTPGPAVKGTALGKSPLRPTIAASRERTALNDATQPIGPASPSAKTKDFI